MVTIPQNNKNPKPNVKNEIDPTKNRNTDEKVSIELNNYPNWTKSIRDKSNKFTSFFCTQKDAAQFFFNIINSIFPMIKNDFFCAYKKGDFKNIPHFDKLKNDKFNKACVLISKIYEKEISKDLDIYEVGCVGGSRIIFCYFNREEILHIYPLMIDPNHLLFDGDQKNNQKDYSKKGCSISYKQ